MRGDRDLRSADQMNAELARFDMRANHAVHTIAIRDRQRLDADAMRFFDQLLGMTSALEEGEVRFAPQRRVHWTIVQYPGAVDNR
jgi:hypothetical protein